jgi:hypothetical protein
MLRGAGTYSCPDSNSNSYTHGDSDGYSEAYTDAENGSNAKIAADPSAPPLAALNETVSCDS